MNIEPGDFRNRLRALVEMHGEVLSEEELFDMAECYPTCRGKEHWDVREYARITKIGAREYRVVRGSSVQHVYRSVERVRAAAVRTALNELESRKDPGTSAS
ncbi:MAG: hypothetical protein ACREMF_06590 [Gemmatimonadales bacterium]